MFSGIGKRAGVPNVLPHRLRHTFAIPYLRNGGKAYTLQHKLGHSTLETVKSHLKLAQVDVHQTHRRTSPMDTWRLWPKETGHDDLGTLHYHTLIT
jgi:integrase/recombinase XerD